MIISSLCTHILSQDDEYGLDIIAQQLKSKNRVRTHILEENSKDAEDLMKLLSASQKRAVNLAKEKGS